MSASNVSDIIPSLPEGEQQISTSNLEIENQGVRPKRKRSESKVKFGGAFPECVRMIRQLLNHKYSGPFVEPVDPVALNIPDYLEVIKNPMDLSTIEV